MSQNIDTFSSALKTRYTFSSSKYYYKIYMGTNQVVFILCMFKYDSNIKVDPRFGEGSYVPEYLQLCLQIPYALQNYVFHSLNFTKVENSSGYVSAIFKPVWKSSHTLYKVKVGMN